MYIKLEPGPEALFDKLISCYKKKIDDLQGKVRSLDNEIWELKKVDEIRREVCSKISDMIKPMIYDWYPNYAPDVDSIYEGIHKAAEYGKSYNIMDEKKPVISWIGWEEEE